MTLYIDQWKTGEIPTLSKSRKDIEKLSKSHPFKKYSQDEVSVLMTYKGDGYSALNGILLNNHIPLPLTKKFIKKNKGMDSYLRYINFLDKTVIQRQNKGMIVARGMSNFFKIFNYLISTNQPFITKNFVSSSADISIANYFSQGNDDAIMVFKIPKNIGTFDYRNIEKKLHISEGEEEILIQRNVQFRLIKRRGQIFYCVLEKLGTKRKSMYDVSKIVKYYETVGVKQIADSKRNIIVTSSIKKIMEIIAFSLLDDNMHKYTSLIELKKLIKRQVKKTPGNIDSDKLIIKLVYDNIKKQYYPLKKKTIKNFIYDNNIEGKYAQQKLLNNPPKSMIKSAKRIREVTKKINKIEK